MAEGSHGTLIKILIESTLTIIPGVEDIEFNLGEYDEIDVTHQGSLGQEEIIKGVRRGQSLSFSVQWDESNEAHQELIKLFDSNEPGNMQILFPGMKGDTYNFKGYVMGISAPAPVSGKKVREISIRITGQITKQWTH